MKNYLPVLFSILLLTAACSTLNLGQNIVAPETITGTYNLIAVGGTFAADAERVVILDVETDDYSFRPVTGPGRVKNFPGLSAAEALKKAEEFFATNCAYNGFLVREMKLPSGNFIGYEITPDYPTALCEDGNEIRVSYGMGEDGEIKVYTWLLLKVDDGGSSSLPAPKKGP